MGFGSVISIGAIVVAAVVLAPRGIQVDDYHQAALMLTTVFPFWGFVLFAASMGIACLGAAIEVALSMAYTTAQTFGWNWGEDLDPARGRPLLPDLHRRHPGRRRCSSCSASIRSS